MCVCVCVCVCINVHAELCLTFCDLLNCNPPGSSVHGLSQERILEWVTITSSRGSSRPRNQAYISCVPCIASRFFTCWAITVHVVIMITLISIHTTMGFLFSGKWLVIKWLTLLAKWELKNVQVPWEQRLYPVHHCILASGNVPSLISINWNTGWLMFLSL